MRRAPICAVVLALACSPAFAQVKGPQEVTVPVGRLVAVPLVVDADDAKYVVLGGDYFGAFREYSPAGIFRFQVLGYAPGSGYIVIGAVKKGELLDLYTVTIKVVGVGPVPPDPVPVPPDPVPTPVDPFAQAIKVAAQKDGFSSQSMWTLAGAYRAAAELTASRVNTAGELYDILQAKLKSAGVTTTPAVKVVIGEVLKPLNTILGTRADPVSDDSRAQIKAIFMKIAVGLEQASR